ncbi:FolC bifunctional protein [Daldinia caldariorum]|uniref:FolC bifunctional protein n=1 Tax=Daldinia caldariorum TaxID=326644 RepID=UPI0020087084|nr:FolC bifunctional protein [Daldinia caldariorum]KAI1463232.1 FolC bifunctional protein [Daldinia caldariorum]
MKCLLRPLPLPFHLPLNITTVIHITALRLYSSTMARTYESALAHLDSIQSNRAVTSLFSPPASVSVSASVSASSPSAKDLNALAIPEMLSWLARAGLAQDDLARLRCIHVAGTKGKGSVCAYLTSVLTRVPAAVGRVGTYTSPHLVSVRERIQLDGRPISRELFARYFFEVWDALTEAARDEAARSGNKNVSAAEVEGPASKPFYFRFLTILAFHVFLREGVKSAVVECGIGGEYDSTNVLPAEAVTASVISQLGIDHVGMLGGTLPEIAWNKAGVMKPGRKCFTRKLRGGEGEEEAMRVLRERAAEKKATLIEVEDQEVERWGGVRRTETGSLEGEFQRYNQALALKAAAEHLRVLDGSQHVPAEETLSDLAERFSDGLRQAKLQGRSETRHYGDFTWLVDGAHTAESLQVAAKWFAGKRKASAGDAKVVLLFNQQERDVAKLLESLHGGIERELGAAQGNFFDYAIFARNDVRRKTADEPERDLAVQQAAADAMRELSPRTETAVVGSVDEAVEKIQAAQRRDGGKVVVLATGSFHLVGALLRILEPDAEL